MLECLLFTRPDDPEKIDYIELPLNWTSKAMLPAPYFHRGDSDSAPVRILCYNDHIGYHNHHSHKHVVKEIMVQSKSSIDLNDSGRRLVFLGNDSISLAINGWMDGWMDGQTDGRMDGWVDGWMDGWDRMG